MNDHLRKVRQILAAIVLTGGPVWALAVHSIAFIMWASPSALVHCDARPYPPATLDGQLAYYWTMMAGWVLVWLSGLLLVGRWSDRLARPARLAVLLVPAVLAIALWWARPLPTSCIAPIASVAGLGHRVQMRFPPGTQLIEAKACSHFEWAVAAKLRMRRDALMPFLKGPFIQRFGGPHDGRPKLDLSRTEMVNCDWALNGLNMDDWHPERLQTYVCASVSGVGQYVDWLVADVSEGPMCTVYFVFAVY